MSSSNPFVFLIAELAARSGGSVQVQISAAVRDRLKEITGEPNLKVPKQSTQKLPRVTFTPGLSDAEILATEERFRFRFPPDLRAFLQTALPAGPRFPNWRSGNETQLRDWLAAPAAGVCFDVERNGFWLPEWGPKPAAVADALAICRKQLDAAPTLIPIYAHRMMPAEPHLPGNPVFSVHQTDIIHYGYDLVAYLRSEFYLPPNPNTATSARTIRFWDPERFQEIRWG